MSKCLHEGIDVAQRHYVLLGYSSGQVLSCCIVQIPVQNLYQHEFPAQSVHCPHNIRNGVMRGFE